MSAALILELIGALTPVANNLISWIEKATTSLKQSAELSDADLANLAQIEAGQNWTIDPDPAPPTPASK